MLGIIEITAWHYAGFIAAVVVFLALDLGVFHRESHEVKFKEALGWSVAWISLALLFCFGFWHYAQWKFLQDPRLLAAGLTAAQSIGLANQSALAHLQKICFRIQIVPHGRAKKIDGHV